MKIAYPTYIVAEIPEPIRGMIQAIRDKFDTPTAKLPVEITLAGSSGVGPIPPGIDVALVIDELNRIFAGVQPINLSFAAIQAFPGGSTVFLSPGERKPLDAFHGLLRDSRIPFSVSPFPYTPHCTIRSGDPLPEEELSEILRSDYPAESFRIDAVSIYSLDASKMECGLLYQRTLEAEPGEACNAGKPPGVERSS